MNCCNALHCGNNKLCIICLFFLSLLLPSIIFVLIPSYFILFSSEVLNIVCLNLTMTVLCRLNKGNCVNNLDTMLCKTHFTTTLYSYVTLLETNACSVIVWVHERAKHICFSHSQFFSFSYFFFQIGCRANIQYCLFSAVKHRFQAALNHPDGYIQDLLRYYLWIYIFIFVCFHALYYL